MRDENGTFQWSAFDKNRCDYYYQNGQQMRFYRQSPAFLAGPAIYETFDDPTWTDKIVEWFLSWIR